MADGPAPAIPQETNLVAGVVPDETNTALFMAQQHGIFAAHGLHVIIKPLVSTQDAVPQLLDGSLDVAAGQLPTWIAAQAKGLGPFRVLAPGVELGPSVDGIVTLSTSQISNPGQLAGKVIAVNAAAGNGPLLTDNILATYGISPAQVTYKVEPFPDMSAALASHEVDAAYCTEPWCTDMAQQIGAVPVADVRGQPGRDPRGRRPVKHRHVPSHRDLEPAPADRQPDGRVWRAELRPNTNLNALATALTTGP